MKPRYKERIRLQAQVIYNTGSQAGEGRVLDLTSPGCLIESTGIVVHKGQSLQLTISLHGHPRPLIVSLGVVRWTKGKQFGAEFIKMDERNRAVLDCFMAQHLSDLTLVSSNKNCFNEPERHNWHLQTFSMTKRR